MAEMKQGMEIPEDLREEYTEMKICALRDNAEHYKDRCLTFIERIAKSEAAVKELRELLRRWRNTHSCGDEMSRGYVCKVCEDTDAALAESEGVK